MSAISAGGEMREGEFAWESLVDPEILKKLEVEARVISGDVTVKMKLGEPGKGSFFDEVENVIIIDAAEVLTPENFWKLEFIVDHEAGHRAVTRGPITIGLKKEKAIELFGHLGFPYLHNVQEDVVVKKWVPTKFPGSKDSFERHYDSEFAKDNTILVSPEVQEFMAVMGYEPKFAQFGSEIMRHEHTGRFSEKLDPDVKEILEKTREAMAKGYNTIPDSNGSEKEKKKKARERFLIMLREVWPDYKELVRKDLDTEKVRQMVKEFYENIEKKLMKMLSDFLPPDLKNEFDEINKKLDEAKKEGKLTVIKMDDLSEELKKKLKEFFEKVLGIPEQKRLEDKADKTLKELEDKINIEIRGKLNPEAMPTHADIEAGSAFSIPVKDSKPVETEAQKKLREAKEKEELEKIQNDLKEAQEASLSVYDRIYRDVSDKVSDLQGRLEKLFRPSLKPQWKGGFPSGDRPALDKAMASEIDPSKYTEEWERKEKPKKMDYRFTLLVDLSGSMSGDKIHETIRGVVLLAEVLDRLGIQFEIIGFQDVPIFYKSFDQKLDSNIREQMAIAELEPENMGVHNRHNHNSDGFCLEEAHKRLEAHKGKNNFLIVFSDGFPAPDFKHSGPEYDLISIVEKIKKAGVAKLIGLGLGEDTEHVEEYYPTARPNLKMHISDEDRSQGKKSFHETLADLLEDMIRNPEKYK